MFLANSIRSRYQRWLKRRMPASTIQILNHRNIFIFPSKAGLGFLTAIILLWLLGTNYQNNLIIALAFLLLSLLHTCIFYTYANFSGLSIQLKAVSPAFEGNMAAVTLLLKPNAVGKLGKHHKKAYHSITLSFPDAPAVQINILPGQPQTVVLPLVVGKRGWYRAPRLNLSTVYPLGIMRAWSYLDMDARALVYPQQIAASMPVVKPTTVDSDSAAEKIQVAADVADDISHLRDYQQGDSIRHIAWKTYAKGQGLATKAYESVTSAEQQQWLDWDDFSGFGTEARLSRLCYCAMNAEDHQQAYGLRLPTETIPVAKGEEHKRQVLKALALYGQPVNADASNRKAGNQGAGNQEPGNQEGGHS